MKKVSELEGVELDYWVARAQGWHMGKAAGGSCDAWRDENNELRGTVPASAYMPSTNWGQGGLIIEERHILIGYDYIDKKWSAHTCRAEARGNTALIAAMRCFVASFFGDEVDDENK